MRQLAVGFNFESIPSIDAVYVSPTARTRQTLALLCSVPIVANNPQTVDNLLIELSQGTAEGKQRKAVYTTELIQQRNALGKEFTFPNGESINIAALRLDRWLKDVAQRHEANATILAISHAMLIRSYVSNLNSWTLQQTLDTKLENCRAVELYMPKEGKPQLIRFNADLTE